MDWIKKYKRNIMKHYMRKKILRLINEYKRKGEIIPEYLLDFFSRLIPIHIKELWRRLSQYNLFKINRYTPQPCLRRKLLNSRSGWLARNAYKKKRS